MTGEACASPVNYAKPESGRSIGVATAMKKIIVVLILAAVLGGAYYAYQQSLPGEISGGQAYHIPDWFKVSFLELHNDAREAEHDGKQLLLFMHLENCPYCKKVLDENFRQGEHKAYIQQHFEVVDINIRGGREVYWGEGIRYNEKELAQAMNVVATPTLVFMNGDAKVIYKVNGYRAPQALMYTLRYVQERQYQEMSLNDYIEQHGQAVYRFQDHPQFEQMSDFSQYPGPLAVIFEDPNCTGCAEFHQYTLQHPDVIEQMQNLKVVRLNAYSNEPIIDPQGNATTPKQWAEDLKLDYRPGTVLFDNGEEVTRADGQLYHFHYKEMLRYVAKGLYFEYPTYLTYLSARQRQLVKQGVDIDLSR